jgi:hypothetical protein
MRRAGLGIGWELLPLALIVACLAGTLSLVIAMHRHAALSRDSKPDDPPPTVVVTPEDEPEPETEEPELPPPAPMAAKPPEDLTRPIVDGLKAKRDEQARLADEATRQADALESARKAAMAESDQWRSKESATRAQIEEIRAKADQLEQRADELAHLRDVLAQERDAAKAALMKARVKNGGFAVMPHKSANGTWQRPVILECKDGKAFLQPQGLAFSMIDMSPFLDSRSPLVVAVASELIRVQRSGAPDGSTVIPYIYFVVRPDGIRPFYQARGVLERLGIAFGYELVDQDWDIDFPNFDNLVAWEGPGSTTGKRPTVDTDPSHYVWPSQRQNGGGSGFGSGNDPANPGGSGDSPFLWPAGPRGGGVARGDSGGSFDVGGSGSGNGPTQGSGPVPLARADGRGSGNAGGFGSGMTPGQPSGSAAIGPGRQPGTGEGRGQGGAEGLVPLDPSSLPGLDTSDTSAGAPPPLGSDRFDRAGVEGKPGSNAGSGTGSGSPYGTPGGGRGAIYPSAGDGRDQPLAGSRHPVVPTPNDGRVAIDPELLARAADEGTLGDPDRPPALPRNAFRSGQGQGRGQRQGEVNTAGEDRGQTQASTSSDAAPPPPLAGTMGDSASSSTSNLSSSPSQSQFAGSPASSSMSPSSPSSGISLTMPSSSASSDSSKHEKDLELTPPRPRERMRREQPVEVDLDLTVACGPTGVVIHPGGYRLSLAALKKDNLLKTNLETIVRNHQIADPMVKPRPRLEFLVEPGGGATYQLARKQTLLPILGWPATFRLAESTAPQVLSRERL